MMRLQDPPDVDLLNLDAALSELALFDPRTSQVAMARDPVLLSLADDDTARGYATPEECPMRAGGSSEKSFMKSSTAAASILVNVRPVRYTERLVPGRS
jgi:hypothetical protein